MTTGLMEPVRTQADALVDSMGGAIEAAIAAAPNNRLLQQRLDTIGSSEDLLVFLHRFLHFNDALAARVPYLAGWIHLKPDLFADPDDSEEFCRQRNASISAHIAEAANDEYRIVAGRNMVHQRLSQNFFRGALEFYGVDGHAFDRRHKLPPRLVDLLGEARRRFFDEADPAAVFNSIGFHVGLEFFANEEFNLVDAFLCQRFPDLVAALKRTDNDEDAPYLWLSLHTVVEVGHYRAGLEAVADAIRYCRPRESAPYYAGEIMAGLAAFADLQLRFYNAALGDGSGIH
jgi:hypothetical protein